MTATEIRQSFLDYFARHGHRIVTSSSLVPGDDPTLLFTNAGMNQFKDLFLGRERRDYRRATTSQKCMRVSGKHNDLDNVGPSLRHHTFFEMLGNFSFGDYFKADAIPLAWTLLTDVWQLDPARLFPTIFKGEAGIPRDDEAYRLWTTLVPASRITELGLAENFWQMGDTGPCGRCSEIHYFRGPDVPCDQPVCRGVECSCQRYVEVWNNVFMEFARDERGVLAPLPAPSIDTGMGLERITAVLQGHLSNYDTDLFRPILNAVGERAGRAYTAVTDQDDHPDVSMRVIADHLRAMTFLVADGVLPSNEWRGYVLRKIMRRAMRHGKKLGFTQPFLCDLVDVVVTEMRAAYPELISGRDAVVQTVRAEEERFDAVLTSGLPRLEELIARTRSARLTALPGAELFRLYDSLGVPLDFAEDLAGQHGLGVDRTGFDEAMAAQRERARASSSFDSRKVASFSYPSESDRVRVEATPDHFEGYQHLTSEATLVAVFDETRQLVPALAAGSTGYVVLDRTPFYVEAGGQVSDVGTLSVAGREVASVTGMTRLSAAGPRAHRVTASKTMTPGERLTAQVDVGARAATERHHTATHLLHAALRQRLGTHVRQAGSLVNPDRLRFDFSHFQGLTTEDREAVERAVNTVVYSNLAVTTDVKRTEDAMASGAMALFGEKYGEKVRVVSVGSFSLELCGGTHVAATGAIGPIVLTEESGVAAGVRRIEALAGDRAIAFLQQRARALDTLVEAVGTPLPEAAEAVRRLAAETKRLARENAQLKVKAALSGGTTAAGAESDTTTVGNAAIITRRVSGLDKDALRGLSDSLRDRIGRGVVVLAAIDDDRVHLVVAVTKDLTNTIKAGQLVKDLAPMIGGRGGGRPDFAEAGGKDATRVDELFSQARALMSAALG